MVNKKLSTLSLSGLIIGPILGSGLIILPPLLFNMINNYSLFIWASILILGFVFALVFAKLAILYPGEAGVSLATKEVLGKKYQLLTSFYLICAVFFGPVAVLLIAAKFLQEYFSSFNLVQLSLFIYLLTYLLLLVKIHFLGKLMLIVSSSIALIFLCSSIYTLIEVEQYVFTLKQIEFSQISYSFLLAFWAIVGWEVIGNYSNEVEEKTTLTKAVIFSAIIISLIYTLSALAISFGSFPSGEFKLVYLIEPLFKDYSHLILSFVSIILCIGTLILFIGAVARLISSLNFTSYTSKHLKNNSPIGALNFLSMIYFITLSLVYFDYLTLDNLVAYSDAFFIANALIGLFTAILLFKKSFLRTASMVLAFVFFIILLFSNIYILAIIISLFVFTFFKAKNENKV